MLSAIWKYFQMGRLTATVATYFAAAMPQTAPRMVKGNVGKTARFFWTSTRRSVSIETW
jgi:hypothetical protein